MAAMPQREASAPGSEGQSAGEGSLGRREALSLGQGKRDPPKPQRAPAQPPASPLALGRVPRPTHGKPEASVAQVAVESFTGDTRLHYHREVFRIQLRDPVHVGQVNAHTALVAGVPRRLTDPGVQARHSLQTPTPELRPSQPDLSS